MDTVANFEQQALSQLPSLLSVASRLTRNPSESEDLVQDTYVKALRAKDQFQADTNMRAWLLRILTNTFINRYRRGTLERSVADRGGSEPLLDGWMGASSLESTRDPEATSLRPILEAEIQAALASLPEDFRLAVVLADVEELSYKEIADVMGCPVGTVMSRLFRGRKMLKALLVEHARDLGIIPGHTDVTDAAPIALDEYRARRARAV